jgi:hypothetical protein
MNESDLRRTVERIASTLTSLGIRFHLTGGLASSYYGEPRTTRDADFVVLLALGDVRQLVDALCGGFLINEAAVREAIGHGGMFQALDRETMIKADFHVGELIPGELRRSELKELLEGLSVPLVSKEDAILSKLVWIREGSDRSRTDVLGMLLDPTRFDLSFIRARARELGCADILEGLERDASNLRDPEALD